MEARRKLVKKLRAWAFILLAIVAAVSGYQVYRNFAEYAGARKEYDDAAENYVAVQEPAPVIEHADEPEPEDEPLADPAPIQVDWDVLLETAPDVQAWIYCPDTNINYPVVQGEDNDQYLRHDYLGNYLTAGSIFIEAANAPGFQDSNTVIYGHHMKDGSMFAGLSKWADQEYYASHKYIWLLTPEQDWRVDLFSGYVTPAGSDVYAVFQGPSKYLDEYLADALWASNFTADPVVPLEPDGKYVLLSTCDYTYQDARYVLHGKLVPCAPAPEIE